MEFQLLDRMSFLRFTRLSDTSQIPDRTTIWTFKERLIKAGASESVFDAVNRQLAKHGYIARGGQIIDASIVQVPKQSLNREEKSIVDDNAMPADWSPPKRRQKDIEASANADKRYKLIRKLKVSTASEHDTNHFEEVLDAANTSRAVLADKGYVDGEREARLAGAGWRMFIQRKGGKDKPLSETQERRNRRIARTRARVEHVFAGLAQLGGKALRSIGLARATLHLNWKVATYNLKRLCYLKEARIEAF
jgi:IS5 family transposase